MENLDLQLLEYKFVEYFGDPKALDKWIYKMKLEINKMAKPYDLNEIAFNALTKLADEEQVYMISYEKNQIIKLISQLPQKENYMAA